MSFAQRCSTNLPNYQWATPTERDALTGFVLYIYLDLDLGTVPKRPMKGDPPDEGTGSI